MQSPEERRRRNREAVRRWHERMMETQDGRARLHNQPSQRRDWAGRMFALLSRGESGMESEEMEQQPDGFPPADTSSHKHMGWDEEKAPKCRKCGVEVSCACASGSGLCGSCIESLQGLADGEVPITPDLESEEVEGSAPEHQ